MGTRGAYGVRIDGVDKVIYNQYDSYPGGLGEDIYGFLRKIQEYYGWRTLISAARNIKEAEKITKQTDYSWFDACGGLGPLARVLQAGCYRDSSTFLLDSLFCEWAYLVNLDEGTFEVYEGFQKSPHDKGRYARLPVKDLTSGTYYPVALIKTLLLDTLPDKGLKELLDESPIEEIVRETRGAYGGV